jgi:hypothetical protein
MKVHCEGLGLGVHAIPRGQQGPASHSGRGPSALLRLHRIVYQARTRALI